LRLRRGRTPMGGPGSARRIVEVPLEQVAAGPYQPRWDEDDVEGLCASIREHGLLQPVVLRRTARGYEVVAGHRRLRAAREAGVAKPDARIFRAAAALVGVAPEHVLHVGDDVHHDVLGALRAGMQAAWVDRAGREWHAALAAPPHGPTPAVAEPAAPHERPQLQVPHLAALVEALGLASVRSVVPVNSPSKGST